MSFQSIVCFLLLALTGALADGAYSGNVQAVETTIVLHPSKPSKFITFKNRLDRKSYVEFSIKKPGIDGKLESLPDLEKKSLIVMPAKTVFLPERKRKVRVTYLGNYSNSGEKYYVIEPIFHEKPSTRKNKKDTASLRIRRVVSSHTLVILRPKSPHIEVSAKLDKGKVYFVNHGNAYVNIIKIQYCETRSSCSQAMPNIRLLPGFKISRKITPKQHTLLKYTVNFDDGIEVHNTPHFLKI